MSLRNALSCLAAGLVISASAGCAAGLAIPLYGDPPRVAALTGEWSGTYVRDDGRRDGEIWFVLKEGAEEAYGDVRMTPRNGLPYARYYTGRYPDTEPMTFLSIRFVNVLSAGVEGKLDPYWDPDCRCRATTTFQGKLSTDKLAGTFRTQFEDGSLATGRWTVVRVR